MHQSIAKGIVEYILANQPVSLDTIEARAKTKDWYTKDVFTEIMGIVSKDTRISTSTSDDLTITYKRKRIIKKRSTGASNLFDPEVQARLDAMYPHATDAQLDAVPFKMCFCYNIEELGHHKMCDAIRFPEEYRMQNPRIHMKH
jgi:hypothetical protein